MSRSFLERQSVDRVTNTAFSFVERYTRQEVRYFRKDEERFKKPDNIDIFPKFFRTVDKENKNYVKAIYAAYHHFHEVENAQKSAQEKSENLKKFKQVVLKDISRYLASQIRQKMAAGEITIHDEGERLVNNILRSIAKADTAENYENNARCLQELMRFITKEDLSRSRKIPADVQAKYPVLFNRFSELVNEHTLSLRNTDSNYFNSDHLRTNIGIAYNDDMYRILARPNSFTLRQFLNEDKQLIYTTYTGQKIIVTVDEDEIDAKLMTHIEKGDAQALLKALGNRAPRDRQLELSKRMYQKSQNGATHKNYASAKLGALLEVPERFLQNYLLDNWFVDWITSKGSDERETNRLRSRERQIPGVKNRTVKRLRNRARQRQVSENYSAEKLTQGMSEERLHNLDLARRALNSQTVGAGLISCKPCCLIVDGQDGENSKKSVKSDDHWLKELNRKKYPGNAYIVKTGVVPPTVFYVERSGSVPVITELSIPEGMLVDLQYISGAPERSFQSYNPGEHVQRLRDRYGRDSVQHATPHVRELPNMGRDLMSYMALCTGHIPTEQLPEELEEKYQFNIACDKLQHILDDSSNLREDIERIATARAEAEEKTFEQIDEDKLPDAADDNVNYVYISQDDPVEAFEYSFDGSNWTRTKLHDELCEEFKSNIMSQEEYDQVLDWVIKGKIGDCPVPLEDQTRCYVENKPNSKVWVSKGIGVVVDASLDGAGDPILNSWIDKHKAEIAMQGKYFGIRYVHTDSAQSYLNTPTFEGPIISNLKANGEAEDLRVAKAYIDERLRNRVQGILDKLRLIEDLPSSYFATSDSIVPYDTRQELVARLTECVRNPSASSWDYFRNSYKLHTYDSLGIDPNELKVSENRCTFHYDKQSKQIFYVDANLNCHQSSLLKLPKQYQQSGFEYPLNSQEVFEHITSKLPAESAFKVHTANEALEEIYAEEVASTKSILKKVAQVALSVLFVVLISFIPFVGQAFAAVGVSVATVWIGVVISSAISSLFIARDISKNTLVSSARAELERLKNEVQSFSEENQGKVDEMRPKPNQP